jgi:hypothetical protein
MGIESEEGLLKSGGVVPKRSSGSVSGTQRATICCVQSEKEAMRAAGRSV